jgi:hypothetical protein
MDARFSFALLACFDGRFDVAFLEARQVAVMSFRHRSWNFIH